MNYGINEYKLPVIFIPYYVVDRLKSMGLDYKRVFVEVERGDKLRNIIGSKEILDMDIINRHMLDRTFISTGISMIGEFSNITSDISLYKSIFSEMVHKLGNDDECDSFDTVTTNKYVFIILNRNFLHNFDVSEFEETYKSVSSSVCKSLFNTFFNDKLIYCSAFFKALYK